MPTVPEKRIIKGEPYVLTRNAEGYRVTAVTSPTDKFHRSYQVWVTNGSPVRCSCPDCVEGKNFCKHMREVHTMTQTAAETTKPVAAAPIPAPVEGVRTIRLKRDTTLVRIGKPNDKVTLAAGVPVNYIRTERPGWTLHEVDVTIMGGKYYAAEVTYNYPLLPAEGIRSHNIPEPGTLVLLEGRVEAVFEGVNTGPGCKECFRSTVIETGATAFSPYIQIVEVK